MDHNNSVFKSDFLLSNLERQYEIEQQIAKEHMLLRLRRIHERNKFIMDFEDYADYQS